MVWASLFFVPVRGAVGRFCAVAGRVRCMPHGGSVRQRSVVLFSGRHPGLDPGSLSISGFRSDGDDGHGVGMLKRVQHDAR